MTDQATADADWRPSAGLAALRERAQVLAMIREFFAARAVFEIETPLLGQFTVTEPAIDSVQVSWQAGHGYLQTSPEYAMKRLLAAGAGDIFQICKVFRDGERGARHNLEFTMLEWYRCGLSWPDFIDECVTLLQQLLNRATAAQHWTFRRLLQAATGVDPFTATANDLTAALARHQITVEQPALLPSSAILDLLYDFALHAIGPGIHTVSAFPPAAAALARLAIDADGFTVAQRCELIVDGIEVGNGYHELTDAAEQGQRFAADQARRRTVQLADVAADTRLLAALDAGLPDCCGMAIGLDRVLMCRLGVSHIDDVLAFPVARA